MKQERRIGGIEGKYIISTVYLHIKGGEVKYRGFHAKSVCYNCYAYCKLFSYHASFSNMFPS